MNTCVGLSIKYFGAKVAQLYSSKFDGEETQKATKKMIENLRDSFAELIQGATWMDESNYFNKSSTKEEPSLKVIFYAVKQKKMAFKRDLFFRSTD